jgi:hypothetical protein
MGSSSRNFPKAAIPALFIKMSMVPNSANAVSTAAFTELMSATSAVTANAFTLKERAFAATLSNSSCVLATKIYAFFGQGQSNSFSNSFSAPVISAFYFLNQSFHSI